MRRATVVGAGKYGSTTALRLAEAGLVDEIVMTDIVEGLPQGLALDINQSRPVTKHRTRVTGSNGYAATAGSEVVVITAGIPRKPGMSRMDLLEVNAKIVKEVTNQIMANTPSPVIINVTNPLDEMTALVAEVSGLPAHQVMGQAGILDSSRFADFIADKAGVPVAQVVALTLGSHGETMVPIPSQCRVGGVPLDQVLSPEAIAEVVQRTRDGGAEIVALLKTGSAYFAPSAAAAQMANAVLADSGEVLPVCAWTQGEYGVSGVYLGVPARLGKGGVIEVLQLPLTSEELAALRQAAEAVRAKVADLSSWATG